MGKQVSISLGLKINMWKQASSWIYILDRNKTLFHRVVRVNNRRLQINYKLGIIFIIKGPLGRQNRASIHPPLESFNHSYRSPSFVGIKIFTLGTKYLYSLIKSIICARSWKKGYCFITTWFEPEILRQNPTTFDVSYGCVG